MKKNYWINEKFGSRLYESHRATYHGGENFLVFRALKELSKNNLFIIESWQAAKKLGWIKVIKAKV